jgi:hypothetical protein
LAEQVAEQGATGGELLPPRSDGTADGRQLLGKQGVLVSGVDATSAGDDLTRRQVAQRRPDLSQCIQRGVDATGAIFGRASRRSSSVRDGSATATRWRRM